MKLSEFKRLIREEVRKSVPSRNKTNRKALREAVKPIPVDSSVTSNLAFIPHDDAEGLAEYAGDAGELNNALFIFEGPKTGIIVSKKDVQDAVRVIKDMEQYN